MNTVASYLREAPAGVRLTDTGRKLGAGARGGVRSGVYGSESQFKKMRESCEWTMVMVVQHCDCLVPLTAPLKMVKTINFMLRVFYHNKK